jgi:1-acyl-sn-glycerol-3-phosphate acyltransferase
VAERTFSVFERDPASYNRGRAVIRGAILPALAWLFRIRISTRGMAEHLPQNGPAIVIMNHRGGLDPLILMRVIRPRYLLTMSKIENYDIPIFSTLMRIWGAYPVQRGEADRRALEFTLKLLAQGHLVLIAPEGTRQPAMIEARDGLAYLATKANVPVVPVGLYGTREFTGNLKRLRATPVTVTFGPAFRFKAAGRRIPREQLAQMTREAMTEIAKLIPEPVRGFYGPIPDKPPELLEFI